MSHSHSILRRACSVAAPTAVFCAGGYRRHCVWAGLLTVLVVLANGQPVHGQGLIWSLPEDGAWVRYEGTYTQTEARPESAEGDLTIQWIRHITIKSVGRTTAEYDGTMVPSRWIEIKSVTGQPSEEGIEAGPVGARIYKVLIPETRVIGELRDSDDIPVSFLPVIEGYRQIGDQQQPEPLQADVLHVYPVLSLLRHYKTLQTPDPAEPVNVQIGIPGVTNLQQRKGTINVESPTDRSTHEATLILSDQVPFGIAAWTVRIVREVKGRTEERSAFERRAEITVEMTAQESGLGAQSELSVP